jgi:Recombinase zinc beta ribbon domain
VTYSKSGGWAYTQESEPVRKAYDLLFERRSWPDIAARIGGSYTYGGIKLSLQNPIWKGIRSYKEGRETPLEVKVIDAPLISPERWEAAQKIILEKHTRWAKTKRPPRFLLSGLLRSACGASVYVRCASYKKRQYYYCSSGFPGRTKCGARSVQQESADRTVERIVATQLLDTAFLRTVLGRFQAAQPERDRNAEKHAHQRDKLEAERQRLLRMTLKGTCTEDDFARESKRIEAEMRNLDMLAPAPVPATLDPAKLVVHITRTFARFAKQPFEERRDVLQTVFRQIVLESGSITSLTLNGGFLYSANLVTPSWQPTKNPTPPSESSRRN